MLGAFKALIGMQGYGGKVYSITPDFGADPNPNKISDADYNDLVARHVMFKDMDADPYLKSAGESRLDPCALDRLDPCALTMHSPPALAPVPVPVPMLAPDEQWCL